MLGTSPTRLRDDDKISLCFGLMARATPRTSNHTHGVADLQRRFQHEIRHEPVDALEACKGFGGIIRSNEPLEDRGSKSAKIPFKSYGPCSEHRSTHEMRAHSMTAW